MSIPGSFRNIQGRPLGTHQVTPGRKAEKGHPLVSQNRDNTTKLKTKWMLFWLISLSQNVASIGSLKDDSCTPKPAKLDACNTSQSDHEVSVLSLRILFPDTAKESSFHLLSSGLPWVGQLTTYTAAGQVNSWTKLPGRPRLEPVPQVSPRPWSPRLGGVWSPQTTPTIAVYSPAKQEPLTYADISTGGRQLG